MQGEKIDCNCDLCERGAEAEWTADGGVERGALFRAGLAVVISWGCACPVCYRALALAFDCVFDVLEAAVVSFARAISASGQPWLAACWYSCAARRWSCGTPWLRNNMPPKLKCASARPLSAACWYSCVARRRSCCAAVVSLVIPRLATPQLDRASAPPVQPRRAFLNPTFIDVGGFPCLRTPVSSRGHCNLPPAARVEEGAGSQTRDRCPCANSNAPWMRSPRPTSVRLDEGQE